MRRDADREDFRLRVDLAYVGRDFQGWQIQAEARTVQGELRNLVSRVLDRPVMPVGAGQIGRAHV